MSWKTLLGLEAFPLTESEIRKKIGEAYREKKEVVEFSSSGRKVSVKLSACSAAGMMRGNESYYMS